MSTLSKGELRAILERELPGAIDAGQPVNPYGNVKPTHHLEVVDSEADTMGDTWPPPADGDSAAARQPEVVDKEEPAAPKLSQDDAVVVAERLPEVMQFIRDELGYEFLSRIAAIDYPAYGLIEVVYHVYHLEGGPGQIVRVRVPRDNAVIPSITPFWPGASLEERVCYDLFGVHFPGHPYHRRIYMWDEFEGHPMRKDFNKVGDSYYHFKWKGGEDGEE